MKKIVYLIIVFILVITIVNLIGSIYTLWHKQDLLTNARQQLTQETKENSALEKELVKVKSPKFLDEEARNKLLMVKPGESEVLIDQNLLKPKSSDKKKANQPYWQQWLALFF